ncbi:MAG: TRAP transporter small permease subunit [Deltaproteobacteria bacterium]|nr:TRAP transporter small permease subunit [Deltaproteobacteria bacterium]
MLTRFLIFVDRLNERIGKVISLLMLPMIVLMSFEVFMRYILAAPTMWGTEMVSYLFAGYTLLGGAYTLLYGDHVNINVFYNRQSSRRKAIFDVITAAIFFLYVWVLLWEGSKFALDGLLRNRHSGTDWNPPLYPILMALPIGAFLMLIQGAAKFVRDLHTVVTGKEAAK